MATTPITRLHCDAQADIVMFAKTKAFGAAALIDRHLQADCAAP